MEICRLDKKRHRTVHFTKSLLKTGPDAGGNALVGAGAPPDGFQVPDGA